MHLLMHVVGFEKLCKPFGTNPPPMPKPPSMHKTAAGVGEAAIQAGYVSWNGGCYWPGHRSLLARLSNERCVADDIVLTCQNCVRLDVSVCLSLQSYSAANLRGFPFVFQHVRPLFQIRWLTGLQAGLPDDGF